ncbi:hypothetical protein MSG28_014225 [Choristoneura fumiferana]|uniref:Uncharacterized protein n=1 Tax=Choristoneura fumiferana TaxID=7141 RepID=A0ACC0JG94_CHOFU|nr:hypothetical protein MSG28_014225 [Choristoneura fumiferana]
MYRIPHVLEAIELSSSPSLRSSQDVLCEERGELKPGDKMPAQFSSPLCHQEHLRAETCLRDQDKMLMRPTVLRMGDPQVPLILPAQSLHTETNSCKHCCFTQEMTRFLDCGMGATKEAIANTKALLNEYQLKIKSMEMEYICRTMSRWLG